MAMFDGSKIKKIREEQKISRAALSKELHIPIRTLEDWEYGKTTPRNLDILNRVAEYLSCTLEDFYDDGMVFATKEMILSEQEIDFLIDCIEKQERVDNTVRLNDLMRKLNKIKSDRKMLSLNNINRT